MVWRGISGGGRSRSFGFLGYRLPRFWHIPLLIVLLAPVWPSMAKEPPLRPGPTYGHIEPKVAQQGTEVEVLLFGTRLYQIEDFLFYREGIEFIGSEPVSEWYADGCTGQMQQIGPGHCAKVKLRVAKDCPTGRHLFRVQTDETLSEMSSFWITPYQVVAEDHWWLDKAENINDDFDHAQSIELGTTVYGYMPSYNVVDNEFFKVELVKGHRLTVEIWADVMGFKLRDHDLALRVYDSQRKQIAFNDDSVMGGQDPWLSLMAPETGTYYIHIREAMDMESHHMHYVAHFTSGAKPTVCYPLGGRAGTTLSTRLIGDPSGDIQHQIVLPEEVGAFEESMVEYWAPSDQPAVGANLVQVADFDNVLEDGSDHSTLDKAQVYQGELPIAFNGIIDSEGQQDWFRFYARAGERYRVTTYAATLGSPIDAQLVIKAADGLGSRINIEAEDSYFRDRDQSVGGKWSTRENLDPIVMFEPDKDGEYFIGISDSQRMYGPDYAYRVEFQPFVDRTFIKSYQDYREDGRKRDSFVVPIGNTIERRFEYIQVQGNKYQGELEVVAEGLPPGVSLFCGPTKVGSRSLQLIVQADADAKPWTGLIDISLRPTDPGVDFVGGFHRNSMAKGARGGFIDQFYMTRQCALSVVPAAPFRIKVVEPKIPLVRNAQLELEVEIERLGYDHELRLQAAWLPTHVSGAPPLSIPSGETKVTYTIAANQSAGLGKFPVSLTLHEDLHYTGSKEREAYLQTATGYHYVASPPVWVEVADPYLELSLARTAIERQKTGRIEATIKTLKPLPSTATAKLVGLPPGVEQAGEVKIQPADTSVSFPIKVTRDCLLGQYKDIRCEVTISDKGQQVTQVTGNGVLRVDEERRLSGGGEE